MYEAWERCKKRDFHTEGKNSENWRIKAADILEGLQDQTTSYNTGIFRRDTFNMLILGYLCNRILQF